MQLLDYAHSMEQTEKKVLQINYMLTDYAILRNESMTIN